MEKTEFLKFLGKGALFCLGLLIFFEASQGNWWKDHRFNDLVLKRNVNQVSTVSYCAGCPQAKVHFQTDGYGFRGKKNDFENVDIMTLGASTTVQLDINQEDTWQNQIAEYFLQNHNRKLNILNAGVDAQSTIGFINNFEMWFPMVPGLHAKFILVYLGIDEIFISDEDKKYSEMMDAVKAPSVSLAHYIAMNSATYFVAKGLWGTWMNRLRFGAGHVQVDFSSLKWTNSSYQVNHAFLFRESLAAFRGRLKILAKKIKAFGATPIFVSAREGAYQFVDGEWVGTEESYIMNNLPFNGMDKWFLAKETAETVKQVSAEEGAFFVTMVEDREFTWHDFSDYRHNTPDGTKRVGRAIAKALEPLILGRK